MGGKMCILNNSVFVNVTRKYIYWGTATSYLVEYAFLGNSVSVAQLAQ
jgi:hypothetical protein